jgi:phosphate acetyltransferase
MSSPFLSLREAVAPQDLLDRAKRFAPPRVAIARAGAPLPMEAAEDATRAGILIPVFVGEADLIHQEARRLDMPCMTPPAKKRRARRPQHCVARAKQMC